MTEAKLLQLNTPADVAEAIAGLSDAGIDQLVADAGVDAVIDHILHAMVARFRPERAAGRRARVQWEVLTPEGERVVTLKLDRGECSYEKGSTPNPDTVLRMPTAVFVRLLAGRLNGMQAFNDGDLEARGDLAVAQLQQHWFDIDTSSAPIHISRPSELRKLLAGRGDAEIEAGVIVTGIDRVLDLIFDGMVDHFLPQKAGRKRAVIQFSVRTDEGDRAYYLDVDRGRCTRTKGTHPSPNVTIMCRLPNFMRLVSGELDGIRALMQGSVRVRGNILLARGLQNWFDQKA